MNTATGGDAGRRPRESVGHEADHDGEVAGEGARDEEGRVVLSPAQREAAGIRLGTSAPREIPIVRELPGEIVINADRLAHVVPRFPGIAQEVRKSLGDQVQAGEVLAVIEANESLALYEVKARIAGTVIEKHITLGEYVSDEQDIYVIADLSSVWANVTVYARIGRIRSARRHDRGGGVSRRPRGGSTMWPGGRRRPDVDRADRVPNHIRVCARLRDRTRTDRSFSPTGHSGSGDQNVRGQSVVFVEGGEGSTQAWKWDGPTEWTGFFRASCRVNVWSRTASS
jgi:biotin carboxyl carrier protein